MAERLIYAIGDVHGCADQFADLLEKIHRHADGRPYRGVLLGDYVDRGPKSREVVQRVKNLLSEGTPNGIWIALQGDHEEMMACAVTRNIAGDMWIGNGGETTLTSYQGHDAEMRVHAAGFATFPTMLVTENHVFVHAGLRPSIPLDQQSDNVRLWSRGWESAEFDFGKHVVYGHSIYKAPKLLRYSSGLDTGCYRSGVLTCGVFDADVNGGPIAVLQTP